MGRLTTLRSPRKYPIRMEEELFGDVVDWAEHNQRSVNGELVALVTEALEARARATSTVDTDTADA